MTPLINDRDEHIKFRYAVYVVGAFVFLLWFIKALELASASSLAKWGILPRTLHGIFGIITGPLVHGDILHLVSNTLPLFSLGVLLFYFYQRIAFEIFIWIYLVTGFWTWLLARSAYHIGASGVVYGLAAFLFFSGILRRSRQLVMVSGIIILLYGGMVYGVFPEMVDYDVSWESHLLGTLAGVLLSIFFRKTKIDFGQDEPEKDEDEDNEKPEQSYNHTHNSEDVQINYEFKPRKPSG